MNDGRESEHLQVTLLEPFVSEGGTVRVQTILRPRFVPSQACSSLIRPSEVCQEDRSSRSITQSDSKSETRGSACFKQDILNNFCGPCATVDHLTLSGPVKPWHKGDTCWIVGRYLPLLELTTKGFRRSMMNESESQ